MSSINFTDPKIFVENKSAMIQFSYPAVDNVRYNSTDSSFFMPNNSVAPNFSYTDAENNLYISGATIKGYISDSNIKNTTELVLEHQSVNSDKKFYVVIPLNVTTSAKSSFSKLKANSSVSIDLNSDIKTNRNIYHYLSSNDTHVFVFETPIDIKPNTLVPKNTSGVPATPASQKYKIMRNTKVEDEIVCGYSEDSNKKPGEDKSATTVATSFGTLLINIMLIVLFLHSFSKYHSKVIDNQIFYIVVLFVAWVVFFGVFTWSANTKKTNYTIATGSLWLTITFMFSLVFFPESAYAKFFVKSPIISAAASAMPPPKPPIGLGFLKTEI
jgi:hypothetical protein